ncbi:MAG: hypothetical protein JXB00_16600 [Bacteroidales bacterium]|nr:hypothetical protein [Bacteroidales bacterium]
MKTFAGFLVCFLIVLSCAESNEGPVPEERLPKYTIETIQINAPSLKNSKIKVDTVQYARVFLPPFYKIDTDTSYPVVYFIHGFSSDYREDYGIFEAAYNAMVSETINDFIIVTVNSRCGIGGSFCVNSPVTGNWEDHLSGDVISQIDVRYRTIAKKESRGIGGMSMGGFGALYLGLRHADIYNLVYAISPGVLKEGDFTGAYDLWLRDGSAFLNAYGAAFSPNTELGYPYAEKPVFDGSENDNRIIANWINGFGNFDKKVDEYLAGENRLKSIALDYGSAEYYFWIPRGCDYLAGIFENKDIIYEEYITLGGDHAVNIDHVKNHMLPFFSMHLSFEK